MCDGTKNVKQYRYRYFFPVTNIFDTDTGTFFGTKCFRYRFQDFFRYQILAIPVPRLFSGTKFFRYRVRYHQKNKKIPVPVPIRYRYLYGTGTHYKSSKLQNFRDKIQFLYQIFPICTYRFRDFFPVPNFSDTTK